jgi:hypothetical protein
VHFISEATTAQTLSPRGNSELHLSDPIHDKTEYSKFSRCRVAKSGLALRLPAQSKGLNIHHSTNPS